jgi:DNA-binding transcriptional LysR family regulator
VRTLERGSFSAAARDLGVSQSAVTRAVQQLEDHLGAALLTRSTRALRPTAEGLEYLEHCRDVLAAIQASEMAVGRRAGVLSGNLTVFAPVSLGRRWIIPRIAEFMARHPGVEVTVKLEDRRRDLIEDRIDVAIQVGPLPDSGLRARSLIDVDLHLVGAPSFWRMHGEPGDPAALSAAPALIFDGPVRRDRILVRRGAEEANVALVGRFRSDSSEAMLEAAIQGIGWLPAPTWLVDREREANILHRVLPDWAVVPRLTLFAVYPPSRTPNEKTRRFLDWLSFDLFTAHAIPVGTLD